MKKLFSRSQIRAWDLATTSAQGISSWELMERAAMTCAGWLAHKYSTHTPIIIFCGMGNNGGDGLAISRILLEKGYSVLAFVMQHQQAFSQDAQENFKRLQRQFPEFISNLNPGDTLSDIPKEAVLVDALFGTGLSRPLTGFLAEQIAWINSLPNDRIAVDLPSGLQADVCPDNTHTILKANHTLSFQQYKIGMLHPESGPFCGNIHLLDIGLDAGFQSSEPSGLYLLDKAHLKTIYKPRNTFSNKGTYGTALIIAGSKGMMGAAVLASKAAARAGCGKVKALIPACGYTVFQTSIPDAMCVTSGEDFIENMNLESGVSACGIGPGIGTEPSTVKAFKQFIDIVEMPIVLDADALNILGNNQDWLVLLPQNTILTPHPKEFERLFGKTKSSCMRNALALEKAKELNIIIVAKDTHTFIALPTGQGFYNTNGNAGLATGGTGDVLCGIITGLLAQGYTPADAALLGVYLHGAAGDEAAAIYGQEALLASDVVGKIGAAFVRCFYAGVNK